MPAEDEAMSMLLKHRFTVEQYREMGAAGILKEDDRVELIDGEVVRMSPIGGRHAAVVNRWTGFLVQALGKRAIVAIQNPVQLPPHSEPQPDVAVLKPRQDCYETLPKPEDVLLLIEVADTSLAVDREVKGRLYAEHGIREYWVVNLEADRFEVHRSLKDGKYTDVRTFGRGETISPEAFPDLRVEVDRILG